jgi:hypothetical protein
LVIYRFISAAAPPKSAAAATAAVCMGTPPVELEDGLAPDAAGPVVVGAAMPLVRAVSAVEVAPGKATPPALPDGVALALAGFRTL